MRNTASARVSCRIDSARSCLRPRRPRLRALAAGLRASHSRTCTRGRDLSLQACGRCANSIADPDGPRDSRAARLRPAPAKPATSMRLAVRYMIPLLAVVAVIALWAVLVRTFSIAEYLLPAPEVVAARMVKDWFALWRNGIYTLLSVLT